MCHSSYELAVLDNGRAAHSLDYSARLLKERGVCYLDVEALSCARVAVDIGYLDLVFLRRIALKRAVDMRLALADVVAKSERERRGRKIFGERGHYSKHATFGILQKRAAFSALEVSFQLAGSAAKSFYHSVNADVYYRAARDNQTQYDRRREELKVLIQQIYDDNRQIFGAEKITAILKDMGEPTTVPTVRELMQELGLLSVRLTAKTLYDRKHKKPPKNLLN